MIWSRTHYSVQSTVSELDGHYPGAMLGQIGLPGGGFGCGYGSMNGYGNAYGALPIPSFPIPANPCDSVIQVARISHDAESGGPYALMAKTKPIPTRAWCTGQGQSFPPSPGPQSTRESVAAARDHRHHEICGTPPRSTRTSCPATTTLERNDVARADETDCLGNEKGRRAYR